MIALNTKTRFVSRTEYEDADEHDCLRVTPPGTMGVITSLDSFPKDGDCAVWYPATGATGYVTAEDLRNKKLFSICPNFSVYDGPRALDITSIGDIPMEEQHAFWELQGETGEMSDEDMDRLYEAWYGTQQFHQIVEAVIAKLPLLSSVAILDARGLRPPARFTQDEAALRQAVREAYRAGNVDGTSLVYFEGSRHWKSGRTVANEDAASMGRRNVEALAKLGRLTDLRTKLDAAWDVFEVDGALEIQRVDEFAPPEHKEAKAQDFVDCFFSDLEAVGFAFLRAVGGDERAMKAIATVYGVPVPVLPEHILTASQQQTRENQRARVPPASIRPWVILEELVNLAQKRASEASATRALVGWQQAAEREIGDSGHSAGLLVAQRTQSFVVLGVTGQFDWPELIEPGKARDVLMDAARECGMVQFIHCDKENMRLLKSFPDIVVCEYDHERGGVEAVALENALERIAEHPADFQIDPGLAQASRPSVNIEPNAAASSSFEP